MWRWARSGRRPDDEVGGQGAMSLDGGAFDHAASGARGLRSSRSARGLHAAGWRCDAASRSRQRARSTAGYRGPGGVSPIPDGGQHDGLNCSIEAIEMLWSWPEGGLPAGSHRERRGPTRWDAHGRGARARTEARREDRAVRRRLAPGHGSAAVNGHSATPTHTAYGRLRLRRLERAARSMCRLPDPHCGHRRGPRAVEMADESCCVSTRTRWSRGSRRTLIVTVPQTVGSGARAR